MTEATQTKPNEMLKSKMEDALSKYLQGKEIVKERNEENKMLLEELEMAFAQIGEDKVVFELQNGQKIELTSKHSIKEKLNKDTLAEKMQVAKDELRTPFDFCIFTKQGKLTPDMITENTERIPETKLKISKKRGRRARGEQ